MVFEQFHTTYQSDYTWPHVKTYGLKSADAAESAKTDQNQPLLDAKVHPIKVGECPQSETSRFNQPDVFLEKLKQKFPFIYECLQATPNREFFSRINQDRLKTTYRKDYCEISHLDDKRPKDDSKTPKIRFCDRQFTTKQALISKSVSKKATEDKKNTGYSETPTGMTEYQDVISKLGYMVMRDKILHEAPKC